MCKNVYVYKKKGKLKVGCFLVTLWSFLYCHYTFCALWLYVWIQKHLYGKLFYHWIASFPRQLNVYITLLQQRRTEISCGIIDWWKCAEGQYSRIQIDYSSFCLSLNAKSQTHQRPPTKMFLITAAISSDKPRAKINKNTLLCQPPSLHCKYCCSMQGSWSTYPLLSLPHPN